MAKHKFKLNDIIEIDFFQSNPRIGIVIQLRPSRHYAVKFPFENNEIFWFNSMIEESSKKVKGKRAKSIKVLYGQV